MAATKGTRVATKGTTTLLKGKTTLFPYFIITTTIIIIIIFLKHKFHENIYIMYKMKGVLKKKLARCSCGVTSQIGYNLQIGIITYLMAKRISCKRLMIYAELMYV